MEVVDNMQEQMGNVSTAMETLRNSEKEMLEGKSNRNKECLCWTHQQTR
jgi:hypothetical protein